MVGLVERSGVARAGGVERSENRRGGKIIWGAMAVAWAIATSLFWIVAARFKRGVVVWASRAVAAGVRRAVGGVSVGVRVGVIVSGVAVWVGLELTAGKDVGVAVAVGVGGCVAVAVAVAVADGAAGAHT